MKTVYMFDAGGFFSGAYDAQESPLEPGKFITPTLSTERQVPAIPDGKRARFVADAWIFVDAPVPAAEPDLPPPIEVDPVEKLRLFLAGNPDVAALLK